MIMVVDLPKPPSINHIYGLTSSGKFARSYMTKQGVEWFKEASKKLHNYSRRKPITDDVEVWITLYTARDQDVDNILKPILDLLGGWCFKCDSKFTSRKDCKCKARWSILANDRQVYKLDVEKEKVDTKEEERVSVEVLGY
jgi:Holliday junction resolvase RusA-like endonuclease